MRLCFALLAVLFGSGLYAGPVDFVRRDTMMDGITEKVIFASENFLVTRSAEARDEDFNELYWLSLEDARYDRLSLESFGRVELYVPETFAVIKIVEADLEKAAAALHAERWSCGQLIRLYGDEVVWPLLVAKAVPVIAINQKLAEMTAVHASVSAQLMQTSVEEMVALGTRYGKSGKAGDISQYLVQRYQQLAAGRSDVTIELLQHKGYTQPSIVVRILGQKHPEELIVLGSHIDSINRTGKGDLAPGADDNASGTASHLEVFRSIVENNLSFDRTVEIHGYALEELGLIGSQDIAQRYVGSSKKVVAMLQNDMNLFKGADVDMVWLVTNDVDTQLTADVEQLIKSYQTVVVGKNRLTAGTSDHRSWNRQGIPVVFPTENPSNYNRKIHTADDTIANSGDFTQAIEFSKLSLSFLAHFAGLVAKP